MNPTRWPAVNPDVIQRAARVLRPEIENALRSLVRVPSQTGHEGEAQSAVAQMMSEHGLEVDVWEPDAQSLKRLV